MFTLLKTWREGDGRSAADIAKEIGVTPAMWSRWETGRRPIPAARVKDIERITGISRHVLSPDIFGPAPDREGVAS